MTSVLVLPGGAPAGAAPALARQQAAGWATFRQLDRLSELPPPGVQTRQFSSFGRDGSNNDGFSGAYSCLRHSESGCVLGEDYGPGEIDALWFTQISRNRTGDLSDTGWIRIELDGRVVLDRSLQDVVSGRAGAPFSFPLVADAEQSSGGSYVKVPMPYRESMRVTVQNNPNFYHLGYRHFPTAEGITTFDPADRAEDVLALLRASGTRDPKPQDPNASTKSTELILPPRGQATAAQLTGPGSISALRLLGAAADESLGRALRLRITFDGRTTVDSPVGEFFGSGLGPASVRSLLFAMDAAPGGWYSSWWPMPYRTSATVELVNTGTSEVRGITVETTSAPDARWSEELGPGGDAGYFTTQSHAGRTVAGQDWNFVDTGGRGRLVGVSHTMRGPEHRGFLEGDERVHIDSSPSPQLHGTGTEDFYEGGWYFDRGEFSNPFNGNPRHQRTTASCPGDCTGAYRLLLSDSVGYGSALTFGIEHGQQNDVDAEYASTAYLYTRPEPVGRHTDTVEVGDQGNRAAHGWTEAPGASQATLESSFEGDENDLTAHDEVRSGSGESSFRVTVAPAGTGVLLRRTSDQANAGQRAEVLVDGVSAGVWYQPLGNTASRWLSDTFALPRSATAGKTHVTITLRPAAGSPQWTATRYLVDSMTGPAQDTTGPAAPNPAFRGTTHRSLRLEWKPAADNVGVHSYRIYGARTPQVPISPATLLGTQRATAFVHRSLPPGQTWYYRVVPVDAAGNAGAGSAPISASATQPATSDFDGDGKDDIATFTRGDAADVYVSLSDGTKFVQDGWKWHDFFTTGKEIPLTGDFDGDGKTDVATFTRGDSADVYVSLSDGGKFAQSSWKWHDHFAVGDEMPLVGDFNGDGKDDIATFTRGDAADVYVSLSDGTKFVQDGWKWHDRFAVGDEIPAVGDMDGDGKDDIVTFTRGATANVFVSLSDGTKFVQDGWKWRDNVSGGAAKSGLGDADGDGKEDVISFANGQVTVATSTGSGLTAPSRWHDYFAFGDEVPGIGDFTGDGKADIVTFTRGKSGQAYVATSDGTRFTGRGVLWHNHFALGDELPRPSLY
ncbi:DUF2961 domain-containing protein [Amycolatopsis sp. NPDC058986]|uniref:DUF2961 domain-containing protein n=1 Tax=unclassified Amycolatopsis TaxID=2618356 RepID=UPI00366DAE0F